MPGEEKYGVRYNQPGYRNPRFMDSGTSTTEALSEDVLEYKRRRERFRPEDDPDPKPPRNKKRKNNPKRPKTKRRPSGRSGNYLRDFGRAIGGGCKRVWDAAKHAFTLPAGCRGPKSAYSQLGGYR